jgi:hypothetical protein
MSMRPLPLLIFASLFACACGGSTIQSSHTGEDAGSTDTGSGGGDSASSVDTGVPPPPDAGPGSESVQTSIGPIPVGAGQEETVCITKRLTNPDPLVITNIQIALAPGSHHLIVYSVTDTQENLTPTPCSPFQGLAIGNALPIVFANTSQVTWTFPSGVGFEVPAMQMVRIEAHYINPTASMIQGQGAVTMQGWVESQAPPWQKANGLFVGTTQISIPPQATFSTGPQFQVGPAGTHLISITTHQHRLGTRAQVWASAMPGDQATRIADDVNWSSPAWSHVMPQFDFNGTSGLTYQCDWNNSTSQTITFGESALQEMCFVGGYYYPATGFQLCIDGSCSTR